VTIIEKEEFAIESFKNIQELIRFMDQKAAGLFVVYGIVLTLYGESAKDLNFVNPFALHRPIDVTLSCLSLLIGTTLLMVLLQQTKMVIFDVLRPRLANTYRQNEYSLFYFEHIANMSASEYRDRVGRLRETNYSEQIHSQIYAVSNILLKKTKFMQIAMTQLYRVVVLLILFIIISKFV
jgi:hypothetical protein